MFSIHIIEVNKNTCGENFHPLDLIGADLDKEKAARKAVHRVAKLKVKESLKKIISNMEHVIKKFDDADKREFWEREFCFGKKAQWF